MVGHRINHCGWVYSFCFYPWGSCGFFLGNGFGAFAFGTMNNGAKRFPLLYTCMCLH